MTLKVQTQSYEDLSPTEQAGASNNGGGKEYANYIRVSYNGETLLLESDACEPEDKTFTRDLDWIQGALVRVYMLGVEDGQRSKEGNGDG